MGISVFCAEILRLTTRTMEAKAAKWIPKRQPALQAA
jgi:hypothetical protein